jgi:gamma-glutamyltranspeptidase / glutathione hydrolase
MTREWFEENGYDRIPQRGPLPVSVPGAVDGWFELHERFGRISMEDILAPSIHYAENGFPVTEVIAYFWARNAEVLEEYENFPETFMPDGRAPEKAKSSVTRISATPTACWRPKGGTSSTRARSPRPSASTWRARAAF